MIFRQRFAVGQIIALSLLVVASLIASGCVAPEPGLYRWGNYEEIIYRPYKNGGSDPVTDAIDLAEDMARTEAQGQQVPPGVRVHLGYLYFMQGKLNEARSLFELEREIFPQSEVFINGLLERMEGAS